MAVLVPSSAFAWGPLTHVYLGTEVFHLAPLLSAGMLGLLRRYRQDFLYGNLMADMILGKKYMPVKKSTHSWDLALSLLESSETDSERAFSYGYMCHLAADTSAHNRYAGRGNLRHMYMEIQADGILDLAYWQEAVNIEKRVQDRNDMFLERSLDCVLFSFKTNRRIFKGIVMLSGLNGVRPVGPVSRVVAVPAIEGLREESLDRIMDVLRNGKRSEVLKLDPIGRQKKSRILTGILTAGL